MKTWDEGGEFRAHVLADPDISAKLSPEEVARLLSPEPYLRNVGKVYARVFKEAGGLGA
jgi:adenylosuccinate lyase